VDSFILVAGAVLLATGSALDFIFRLRMTRAGHRMALLLGGAFNYREYHKVRRKYGWPAWPVYIMWASIIVGLALIVVGVGMRYGWNAH